MMEHEPDAPIRIDRSSTVDNQAGSQPVSGMSPLEGAPAGYRMPAMRELKPKADLQNNVQNDVQNTWQKNSGWVKLLVVVLLINFCVMLLML